MPDLNKLNDLIETFDRNRDAYLSGQYNETQVRIQFINPFFKLLGWDVNNELGHAEAYKDVYHEDAIKIGGATKAPDYSFRIGGTRKFFLEAKRPSINIKEDISPAYQLRRYAWSAKLPLSILTDFEEFAVYDCRIKPAQNDKASTARVQYLKYTEYAEKWDEIYSIFSKDAILKGSFDKYAESNKAKRGTAEVDTAFLKEMEIWRENLARNLALRNSQLEKRELNFAVQKILDRIIFLRMCEDRGVENYGQLQGLQNGAEIYPRLCQLFRQADDRYNSGLFHFKEEKGRPTPPDHLTLDLKLDDKILKDILKSLYFPESPYEFSVLPTEILGQVYEQFLGKVIRLTAGHRAIIEEKPEVKKAGGVYYTPSYIVDYIVKQTVGKLLEGKKPGARSAVNKIKILDPACGSGSFLIGAYEFLLTWYRDRYVEMGPQKHKKVIYQGQGGEWRLTTAERKRILLTHLYGVDIDPQAVETTKLSLLLKVLEGESGESLKRQFQLFHERALPDLGDNIKCGNSLIGPDFYDHRQTDLFDDEERYRINVFDWHTEFAEIMKSGGFDAVIGNPPYVRQETLGENFKEYAKRKFSTYAGTADLYVYFIEKSHGLLRPDGSFGMICSNKFMRAKYGKELRAYLVDHTSLQEIVDFGELPVFQNASTFPAIILTRNRKIKKQKFVYAPVKHLSFQSLSNEVNSIGSELNEKSLSGENWTLAKKVEISIIEKLKWLGVPLEKYIDRKIYRGVLTGLNKAFVISGETRSKLIAEDPKNGEIIKPFVVGDDIRKYKINFRDRYLIFSRRGIDIKKYPAIERYLNQFKKQLLPKPKDFKEKKWEGRKPGRYKWYEIQDAIDYFPDFEKPKIVFPDIAKESRMVFDPDGLSLANTIYFIPSDNLYLLGVLNSKLMFKYFKRTASVLGDADKGGRLRWFKQDVNKLPIRTIDFSNPEDKARHDKMVQHVERMLDLNKKLATAKTGHDKNVLQRQIDATDNQIDRLVYELYELTDEEIAIVEESVKK